MPTSVLLLIAAFALLCLFVLWEAIIEGRNSIQNNEKHISNNKHQRIELHLPDRQQEIIMEQYKLYVEMSDRVTQRRTEINKSFITVQATMMAVIILFKNENFIAQLAVLITGVVCCIVWYVLINSYKVLNSGKFEVIHDLESMLPYALFDVEWDKLSEKKYWSLTQVEKFFPVAFGAVYVLYLIYTIYVLLSGNSAYNSSAKDSVIMLF